MNLNLELIFWHATGRLSKTVVDILSSDWSVGELSYYTDGVR